MDEKPASHASRTKLYRAAPAGATAELDANSSYAKVLELIAPGAVVLDVGCGSGELDRYLAERGHEVWGLDANPDALALAAPYCVDVRQADLEASDLADVYGDQRFDVIAFVDSLEHLREPWRALQSARSLLRDGGTVVASIPNFAHAAVRLAVVSGSIPYRKAGILDDTHLRFFTRAGVESLFAECGFAVQAIARTQLAFGTPSNLVPDVRCMRVPVEIERLVREDPESETLQFVVRATPLPGPWDMSALRGVVHDLEARIEESTVGIGNLERSAALLREGLASAQAERDAALARCAEQERVLRGECDALRAELARTERARDEHAEAARAAAEAGETALARAAEAHQHEALAAAEAAEAADARVRDALGRSDASESMMRRAQAAADDAERRAAEASARAEAAASEAAQRAAEIGALREQLDAALRERDEATAQGARARDLAGEWAARAAAATNRTTDETARADAADAREREATARAADAASRAAALTARFAEATEELRTAQARARAAEAELDETRRQMQEIHEDRNRLLLREADRQSLLTVLEDYETHTSDVALGDGRQVWSTTPARP